MKTINIRVQGKTPMDRVTAAETALRLIRDGRTVGHDAGPSAAYSFHVSGSVECPQCGADAEESATRRGCPACETT
jgi:hypothetical protein